MTDESKPQKAEKQIEILELNRETVQDLAELETDQVKGGAFGRSDACLGVPTLFICSRQGPGGGDEP
jgi:hypothetical protein